MLINSGRLQLTTLVELDSVNNFWVLHNGSLLGA